MTGNRYAKTANSILAMRQDEDASITTYPIASAEVEAAESIIGRPFPKDLKAVWSDIGGGFFHGSIEGGGRLDATSCLMGPLDVADIMRNRGWVGPEATKYQFFNDDDEDFILIVESADGYTIEHEHGRGTPLAGDLRDFVDRLAENPSYWIDLLPTA